MSKKVLVPIFLLVLALIIVTGVVSAGSAVVYNHPDGMRCSFSINGGAFAGPATIVLVDGTEDGKIQMHCRATLTSGTAEPTQKLRNVPFPIRTSSSPLIWWLSCSVQITRSGNANVSCPNQYATLTLSW